MDNRGAGKIWVVVTLLFIVSWGALAVLGNFLISIRIKNLQLENTVKTLEQRISFLSLDAKLRQEEELQAEKNKNKYEYEDRVLEYLEWQFVLNEQVPQAKERLIEELKKTKDLRKNNEIKNILYYNLGLVCTLAKDFNSAIEAFEKALVFNPKDSRSQYNLGLLYSTYRQDTKKAIKYYQGYLMLIPGGREADTVKERIKGLKEKGN